MFTKLGEIADELLRGSLGRRSSRSLLEVDLLSFLTGSRRSRVSSVVLARVSPSDRPGNISLSAGPNALPSKIAWRMETVK